MVTAIDVAEYILEKVGTMTAMKLQKMVYYAQAWHLAWTEKPLFADKIQAWRNGPVVPSLYEIHKGCFKLDPGYFVSKIKPKSLNSLSKDQKDIVDKIINFYGTKDPHWLSQLTHMEDPWKNARAKSVSSDQERSSEEITPQSMFEYYSSL
jgi:uncharacterized phage-associated protein